MTKPLLLALATLLLLPAPVEARSRCGPGERALRNGVCATLRPHSPALPPQRSLYSDRSAPLAPAPPPVSRPLPVPNPTVPNLAPPPLVYTPGAGLHY